MTSDVSIFIHDFLLQEAEEDGREDSSSGTECTLGKPFSRTLDNCGVSDIFLTKPVPWIGDNALADETGLRASGEDAVLAGCLFCIITIYTSHTHAHTHSFNHHYFIYLAICSLVV